MNDPEITIRPLAPADIPAVLALWRAAGLPHRPAGRDRPDALAAQIAAAGGLFLGGACDGELVGTVLGSIDGRQKGWVNRLAVDPRFRRRGLAARLLGTVEERLAARGALLIAALVEDANLPSLALFHALGYEESRDIVYLRKRVAPES
jgi:ribosomal protein S18 acetylase RimI-like enzyme